MNVIHFESIDSTNKYLKENYQKLDNLTFVSASFQTNGKGRENRTWISSNGENLLFSFLIKDKCLLKEYKALSIGTATLVARFLELMGLNNVMVKWPNDVYVNDRKICGILLEGNVNEYLVIGVGLNVNQTSFVGEYKVEPTSIKNELNKTFCLNELEVELFEFIYKHINQKLFKSNSLRFYKKHNYLYGKNVCVNSISGKVNGISDDFDLIIDKKYIDTGEVN